MIILQPSGGHTFVSRLDVRGRVLFVFLFALCVVMLDRWAMLISALIMAILLLFLAAMIHRRTMRRIASVNVFGLFLLFFVPLSIPGTPLLSAGPLAWSQEGLIRAFHIIIKANAAMIMAVAMLGSMEPADLGHALKGLKLPDKLIHVLLFTIRYLEVVHEEYHRLRNAMKMRGFRPSCTLHALRSTGHLLGMLFLRSIDRSERILEAMQCRGFCGRFYVLTDFRWNRRDVLFFSATALALLTLIIGNLG